MSADYFEQLSTAEADSSEPITVRLTEPLVSDAYGAMERILKTAWEEAGAPKPSGEWFDDASVNRDYLPRDPEDRDQNRGQRFVTPTLQIPLIAEDVMAGKIRATGRQLPPMNHEHPLSRQKSDNAITIARQIVLEEQLKAVGKWYGQGEGDDAILCWHDDYRIHIGPDTPAARQALLDAGMPEITSEDQKPLERLRPPVGFVPVTRGGEIEPQWLRSCEYWAGLEPVEPAKAHVAAAVGPVVVAAEKASSTRLLPSPDNKDTATFPYGFDEATQKADIDEFAEAAASLRALLEP